MTQILIIEDDPTLQNAYQTTLGLEGFATKVVADGEEGWKQAIAMGPDIILLDMLMPKLGGLDFLKRYQKEPKLKDTKVIVFSNLNSPDDVDEALSLGAAKYMTKSNFTPKEMVAAIHAVLGSSDGNHH